VCVNVNQLSWRTSWRGGGVWRGGGGGGGGGGHIVESNLPTYVRTWGSKKNISQALNTAISRQFHGTESMPFHYINQLWHYPSGSRVLFVVITFYCDLSTSEKSCGFSSSYVRSILM